MTNADDTAPDDSPLDPADGLYGDDGELDTAEIGRRIPSLVALLRTHPACFDLRLDTEALADCLASEAGAAVRAATGDDQLETALRELSRDHLHEVTEDKLVVASLLVLQRLADDEELSRKRRRAAAAGVALTSGLPDDKGVRGRGLLDLLLRVTLEELHAQEMLRRRAAESEDGLTAEELDTFWDEHPALRHRLEERYRKDVEAVLADIENGVVPAAISVDLAVRGAHRLLSAAAAHTRAGTDLDGDEVRDLLATTFESDLLDGGRGLVVGRWRVAQRDAEAAEGDEADARRVATERAIRIVGPGSPAGEMVLFHVYMRAVLDGSFHVRDEDEAEAARQVFGEDGLRPDGVLSYAAFHADRGNVDHEQRVLLAGLELWPDHAGIRDAATRGAESRMAQARRVRHGPRYDELGELDGVVPLRGVRLVALDLDGTLLPRDKRVTAAARSAVDELRAAGIAVTLATGKGWLYTQRYARELAIDVPVVALEGAFVGGTDGTVLRDLHVTTALRRHVAEIVADLATGWFATTRDGRLVACATLREIERLLNLWEPQVEFVEHALHEHAGASPALHLAAREDVAREAARRLAAAELPNVTLFHTPLTRGGWWQVQVRPDGVGKHHGLACVLAHLGLDAEQALACGDWLNDVEMLRMAGVSVAPENAVPEVREVVTHVAPGTCDDDAVPRFLRAALARL